MTKRVVVQFRLTAKEKRGLQARARLMRLTLSQFLRQRLCVR